MTRAVVTGKMVRRRWPTEGSERDVIVAATLDVVATVGFAATTVEQVVSTAGIGHSRFWNYFPDKAAAVSTVYEQSTAELWAVVEQAHDEEADPIRRVVACLSAAAEFLAADPPRAAVLLIEGACVDRTAVEVRHKTIGRWTALLAGVVEELEQVADATVRPERSRTVIEILAGGLYGIAFTRTAHGEVRSLPGLVPMLAQIVLEPFLGSAAAREAILAEDPKRDPRPA